MSGITNISGTSTPTGYFLPSTQTPAHTFAVSGSVIGFPASSAVIILSRLTGARRKTSSPRQVLGRVAPRDVDLFPGHAHHFRRHPLAIRPRFGAKIADARLDVHPAVRLDDKEPVEAD